MIFKKLCLTAACAALISVAGVAAAQSAPSIAQVAENSKEAVPTAFDPVAHKRVLGISEQLRCLVCQNQSIADSNAELAVDLRRCLVVHQRQPAVDNTQQIDRTCIPQDFVVDLRFGCQNLRLAAVPPVPESLKISGIHRRDVLNAELCIVLHRVMDGRATLCRPVQHLRVHRAVEVAGQRLHQGGHAGYFQPVQVVEMPFFLKCQFRELRNFGLHAFVAHVAFLPSG